MNYPQPPLSITPFNSSNGITTVDPLALKPKLVELCITVSLKHSSLETYVGKKLTSIFFNLSHFDRTNFYFNFYFYGVYLGPRHSRSNKKTYVFDHNVNSNSADTFDQVYQKALPTIGKAFCEIQRQLVRRGFVSNRIGLEIKWLVGNQRGGLDEYKCKLV